MTTAAASVVIPTKNRPDLLRRCLRAVLDQQWEAEFEVVIVNDAGCSVDTIVEADARVKLVQGAGLGPAAARNAGVAHALAELVVFTDDDAIPQPGWLRAAVAALERSPNAVGVVGCVESPPFDPLYEHSVRGNSVGNFLTCNVAYRRAALERVGGFDTGFPYPHAEDRDLGHRLEEIGALVYEPNMVVLHPPRPVGFGEVARRGRFVRSDWRLHHRHPQTRPPRWSVRWGPLVRLARHWQRLAKEERVINGSPKRALRFAVLASTQLLVALAVTLRGPDSTSDPAPVTAAGETRRIRVAWIGAGPQRGGAVADCAWLLMEALARRGCDLDWYASGPHEELSERLAGLPGVRLINFDTGWRPCRWYSNHDVSRVVTGLVFRALGRRRLASLLLEQHRRQPYVAAYQFSTIEVVRMHRHLGELPPLVVHPEAHIADKRRWARREWHFAAPCEPLWRRLLVKGLLAVRTTRQRRDVRLAARVMAISRRVGDQLARDYGVDPGRVTLIRNPIDLDELRPMPRSEGPGPWRIAFVSRTSACKGLKVMAELSHRLADLDGDVTLELVGADTLRSDCDPLLAGLDPRIARYHGHMGRRELAAFIADSDLLLQPANDEPFGTTVEEALALGVPVVASDEVGAAEDVSAECCTIVPGDDVGALEAAVRAMLDRLRVGDGPAIRRSARAEAERLFSPEVVATAAVETLAAAGRGVGSS